MTYVLVGIAGFFLGMTVAASYVTVWILARREDREMRRSKPLTGGDVGIVHKHTNIRDFSGPKTGGGGRSA